MSKGGNKLLRATLIRAADTAVRRQDPQLGRIYYIQMVERTRLEACWLNCI